MENPSYYAIIPANVRYDKEITPNAKLLFGEITALCNKEGYCWASNNYFAELYGVTAQAISKWINILAKKGYFTLEYILDGKECKQRLIRVSTKNLGVSTKDEEGINKRLRGYQQKIKDNNTYNTTYNNIESTHKKIENNSIDFLKNISLKFLQGENIEIPEYAEKYKEDFMDFLLYWTETDANGKIRASKEKTFEIKRRFYTWMKRKKENFSFAPVVQQQKPNYGGMYRKPGFDD